MTPIATHLVIPMTDTATANTRSIPCALTMVEALAKSPMEGLSNKALSEALGVPATTVVRIAAQLIEGGWVRRVDETEHYAISPHIVQISVAVDRALDDAARDLRNRYIEMTRV